MTISSDILNRMDILLGKRELREAQMADWWAGEPDGGPYGDGRFPLTANDGTIRLCPSPKAIAAIVRTGLDANGLNQMALAELSDVGANFAVVGRAANGEPKLFTTNLFPARKTAEIDVLPGSDHADWIAGFSHAGGHEVRVPAESLRQSIGNVIDPTHPPYNVVYDARKSKPAYANAGSDVLTLDARGIFDQRDIGKVAVIGGAAGYNYGEGRSGPLVGYIYKIYSDHEVGLATDATLATPLLASVSVQNEAIWGTDCTAGLQRAFDDAEPLGLYDLGKTVVIGGLVLATQLRFGSIGIVGLARTGCGFMALPITDRDTQEPFFADKNDGRYANLKPDHYTLKDFTIYGQRYTQSSRTYRRAIEIRGGQFGSFYRGAPYAVIDGLDVYEGQTDGAYFHSGAFAGVLNNFRCYSSQHCGVRIGFWDLNGQNWHMEGNRGAGIFSFMPGANVSTVRASFNGEGGGDIDAGGMFPDEMGANWVEAGYGSTVTNLRCQESWSQNLVFTNNSPLTGDVNSGGSKGNFILSTFDDTSDMVPGQGRYGGNLPARRAMVLFKGNTATNNLVRLSAGSGQVKGQNYATHGVYLDGYPSGNRVDLDTPGISNDAASWYAGGSRPDDTPAVSRGPWGAQYGNASDRGNVIRVNGVTAP